MICKVVYNLGNHGPSSKPFFSRCACNHSVGDYISHKAIVSSCTRWGSAARGFSLQHTLSWHRPLKGGAARDICTHGVSRSFLFLMKTTTNIRGLNRLDRSAIEGAHIHTEQPRAPGCSLTRSIGLRFIYATPWDEEIIWLANFSKSYTTKFRLSRKSRHF